MSVCLVITKEVNQEQTQMPDTHKGIHINVTVLPVVEVRRTGTGKNVVLPD